MIFLMKAFYSLLVYLEVLKQVAGEWASTPKVPDPTLDYIAGTWISAKVCLLAGNRFEYGSVIKSSDAGFTWKVALPNVNPLYDISSRTLNDGTSVLLLAVSNSGSIYYSNNVGETWSITSVADVSFYGVTIGSNGNAYAVGANINGQGVIYSSSYPQLITWRSISIVQSNKALILPQLNGVGSFDGIHVIAVGNSGGIYASATSGTSWTLSKMTFDLYGVSWAPGASSLSAMVAGNGRAILITSDGGISWTPLSLSSLSVISSSTSFMLHSVHMVSSAVAYAATSNGYIVRTFNAGLTWQLDGTYFPVAVSDYKLFCISMYSSSVGIAGASRGGNAYIKVPEPSSQPSSQPSRQPSSAPSTVLPTSFPTGFVSVPLWRAVRTSSSSNVYFSSTWVSSNVVILAGQQLSSGLLTVSRDQGVTFSSLLFGGAVVNAVTSHSFDSTPSERRSRVIIAVTSLGTALVSVDSALSWNKSSVQLGSALSGVTIGTSGVSYAVGVKSSVFRSNSSSTYSSWTDVSVRGFSSVRLNSVSSFDGTTVIAVGDGGTIFRSSNSGSTWTTQFTGSTATLYSVSCVSAKIVMAAGASAALLKSSDGGRTWTSLQARVLGVGGVTVNTIFRYHSLQMSTANIVYIASPTGVVLLSSNGGRNWKVDTVLPTSSASALYTLSMFSASTGVTADSAGIAYIRTPPPTSDPTSQPSHSPTRQPSRQPSNQPTGQPTRQPTLQPSSQPSKQPSRQPSSAPSYRAVSGSGSKSTIRINLDYELFYIIWGSIGGIAALIVVAICCAKSEFSCQATFLANALNGKWIKKKANKINRNKDRKRVDTEDTEEDDEVKNIKIEMLSKRYSRRKDQRRELETDDYDEEEMGFNRNIRMETLGKRRGNISESVKAKFPLSSDPKVGNEITSASFERRKNISIATPLSAAPLDMWALPDGTQRSDEEYEDNSREDESSDEESSENHSNEEESSEGSSGNDSSEEESNVDDYSEEESSENDSNEEESSGEELSGNDEEDMSDDDHYDSEISEEADREVEEIVRKTNIAAKNDDRATDTTRSAIRKL